MKNSIYRRGARDLALAMNLVRDLTPALDLEEGERLEIFDADGSGSTGYRRQRRQWSQEIPAAMRRQG